MGLQIQKNYMKLLVMKIIKNNNEKNEIIFNF